MPSGENPRAMALMVGAMATFAVEDFLLKRAALEMPVGQVLAALSLGGAAIFAILCRRRGLAWVSPALGHPLVVVRNLCEGIAAVCYVTALALVPLSLASAILQATPLFVTLGAALWLREGVGPRRWAAVIVGLAGVLLMLRPGFEGFRPAALLALAATLALAVRDVASRRIDRGVATLQLSLWAYLALFPGALALLWWEGGAQPGTVAAWRDVGLAVGVGALAYALLTGATRLGDVSAVIPFRYSRLVFALILGAAFLGERPDALTLVGAALVVGSGLYAIARERKRAKPL